MWWTFPCLVRPWWQVCTFAGLRGRFPKNTVWNLSRLLDVDKRKKLGRFKPPKLLDYTAPCAPVSNCNSVSILLLTWVGVKVFLRSQNWKTLTCIFVFLLMLITAAIFLIKIFRVPCYVCFLNCDHYVTNHNNNTILGEKMLEDIP